MTTKSDIIRQRILAARGEIDSDLVLKSGKVVDVLCGEIRQCDVAIHKGRVVGLANDYRGKQEIDCAAKWVVPGLLDGHYHIESSMLPPSGLAPALVPLGTTAIVADPHEIANVMGLDGIRLLLDDSRSAPMDIFFMAPSCVPATHLETSGARLPSGDLKALLREPRVLGLAELMNYPGVLAGAEEVLAKIALFQKKPIDGHAPGLSGRDLQAYLSAGIRSDHETTDRENGLEKVRSGMMLMIREGSSARNLEELAPLVTPQNYSRFCFVSDDLHPQDILERGHLNYMVCRAIRLGMDPVTAVRLATISPSQYFGFRDRGAVAPGFLADLAVLDDLEEFQVHAVIKNGRVVARDGQMLWPGRGRKNAFEARPLNVAHLEPDCFRMDCRGNEGCEARVIELVSHQILTRASRLQVRCEDGRIVSDIAADIVKLAVVERHHATGRIGLGLVKGFGMKAGALATSVAHDSHNIIAVGVGDEEIYRAVREVIEMGGGMAVIKGDQVLARVVLEIAGLMTAAPIREVVGRIEELRKAAVSLGCTLPEPFMTLSFLALPVIPELRLTDYGVVDVNRFEVVPLFLDGKP